MSFHNSEGQNENCNSFESQSNSQNLNVSSSTLEPTAQEFYPSSSSSHNGAIKKRSQQYYNKHRVRDNGRERNKYGTGRTFSGIKEDSSNYVKEKSQNNSEFKNSFINSNEDTREASNSRGRPELYGPKTNKSHYQSVPKNSNIYNGYDNRNPEQSFSHSRYMDRENQYSSNSLSVNENGGNFDKPRKTFNSFKKPERHFYEKSQNYDKYGQTSEKTRNMYKDKKIVNDNSSRYNNANDYSVKRYSNIDYKRSNFDSKDFGYSNQFKSGFKTYHNRNSRYDEESTPVDWRKSKPGNGKSLESNFVKSNKKLDAASQKERLEEMLNRRILECLVCCEKIKNSDKVWSCMLCYHILHLHCVAAWAKSSKVENSWRCPACQNVCSEVPKQYKCYCGKTLEPRHEAGTIPHGCGQMCLRKGRTCDHKCSILCHPGPCPDCTIMVAKECGCGATKPIVKCSTDIEIVCGAVCNKTLECGSHKCQSSCHSGECILCSKSIIQVCYCGKEGRKVPCRAEYKDQIQYACGELCHKQLSCGNHLCQKLCHEGPCDTCATDVNAVQTCPCGKTHLTTPRNSCLDPVPCCNKICAKPLKCGQPSTPHTCRQYCHQGVCPPCPSTTVVRCRCGHMDKELSCQELTTKADDARCEKKCTKKRSCGKHKCNQRCCIEIEHICPLPCNHQLSCGQHRCERTCHSGRCPPCMETSFEELYCECGKSVLFPPIPCGTKPPNCSEPCSRQRPCGHEPNHSCHTGPCPPCTVLSKRWCYGRHEQRSAIPCHQQDFSCGLPCGKEMPCGRHKCNKPCHGGPCPIPCKQPCGVLRDLCGHPCGRPCHDPPCPETSCKQTVPVTCLCGLQKSTRPCIEVVDEFKNIQMAQIKDKMGALSSNHTVDISDILNVPKKPTVLKILECTEECRVLERNRRLAIGLQIRNPDLSQKLMPKYSDFLRQWAKKDSHFCQRVHDKLSELVQLAKNSKQKSRSYSFESMNRDKRNFIHDYCEHFGIESAAYDMEPNRNVVATAIKDKSWLPSMGLLEVIQRENGQRKVPGPSSALNKSTSSKPETVSLKLPSRVQRPTTPPGEIIDGYDPIF